MAVLHCSEICKSFEGVQVLKAVELEFPAKGVVAIIGPNGAGKTTLLNVVTGFLKADAGDVFLGERKISGMAPYSIARLGIARTFQNLRLIQKVSVLENVLLARPNQRGERLLPALFQIGVADEERENRRAALSHLEFVGLKEKQHELAGEISYGQQKLLALACCLATGARILFLDEPVAGVHPEMISKILELLSKLRDQGRLIIFIEHDLSAVRQIADTVIVMDEGRVVAQGRPNEVLDKPEIMEAYVG